MDNKTIVQSSLNPGLPTRQAMTNCAQALERIKENLIILHHALLGDNDMIAMDHD